LYTVGWGTGGGGGGGGGGASSTSSSSSSSVKRLALLQTSFKISAKGKCKCIGRVTV